MAASIARAGTRHGIILIAASVLPVMAIITLVPVLPLLLREFATVPGSEYLVQIALTVPALCVALFSPMAGWLVDRTGRKRALICALCLYAVIGILPWFINDLRMFIAARIALGLSEAVIMTVATTLIGDYFVDERREIWIARQVAAVSFSAVVLVALGGAMGEWLGSRGPFLLYALAIPIAVIAGMILYEPAKSAPSANAPHSGSAVAILRPILPIAAMTVGVGMVFYTVFVQLGPILERSGEVSPAMIGAAGAACNMGVVLGTLVFQQLKRFAGPALLALGLAIAAAGYCGAGVATGFIPISAFAVLACIGSGIALPNMLAWTMQFLPAHARGRGTGLWTGSFFFGQFAAPLVATALLPVVGGLDQVLLLIAGVATGAALIAAMRARGRPKMPVIHQN